MSVSGLFWHSLSFVWGSSVCVDVALSIKLIWQIMHPGILLRLLCASSNYLPASPPPTLGRHTTHLVPALHGNTKAGGSKATAITDHYHSSSAITQVIMMICSSCSSCSSWDRWLLLTDTLYIQSPTNSSGCRGRTSSTCLMLRLSRLNYAPTRRVIVCCWFKRSANTLKCYRMSGDVPEERRLHTSTDDGMHKKTHWSQMQQTGKKY